MTEKQRKKNFEKWVFAVIVPWAEGTMEDQLKFLKRHGSDEAYKTAERTVYCLKNEIAPDDLDPTYDSTIMVLGS